MDADYWHAQLSLPGESRSSSPLVVPLIQPHPVLSPADNDKRIHAFALFKQELDNSSLSDPDTLANVLRTSLKSNNAHVSSSALACLPPFFRNLVPPFSSPSPALAHSLKHAFALLLPFDKLGDAKVATRQLAREGLISAAQASLRLGTDAGVGAGKDKEGPWQVLEKGMVEYGFRSKSAKAREQSLHFLEAVRCPRGENPAPLPPLRPYTAVLLPLLSDSDSAVRSLALSTTISVFTYASVPAGAKADLKKELAKLDVAKKVQDHILAAVLGGVTPSGLERSPSAASLSSAGGKSDSSRNGALSTRSATSSHLPPPVPLVSADGPARRTRSQAAVSTAPTPSLLSSLPATAFPSDPFAVHSPGSESISPVYLASERDLRATFEAMKPGFVGKETEHNWQVRDKSIAQMRGMILGGVTQGDLQGAFVKAVKEVAEAVARVSSSLRTTLALSALSLITELSQSLPPSQVDLFLDPFLPHTLSMAGQTKKIVASASQATVTILLERSSYHLRSVQLIHQTLGEKVVAARQYGAQHLFLFLRLHSSPSSKTRAQIDATGGADELEAAVKKALGDPNAQVRETARKAFWAFEKGWPVRGERVMGGLDKTARGLLEKVRPVEGEGEEGTKTPVPAAAAAKKAPAGGAKAGTGTAAGKKPSVREMMLAARRKKQQEEEEAAANAGASSAANGPGFDALPEDEPRTPPRTAPATSRGSLTPTSAVKASGLLSPASAAGAGVASSSSPLRSPRSSPRPLASPTAAPAESHPEASFEEEEAASPSPATPTFANGENGQSKDDLMHSPSPFRLKSPLPSATPPALSPAARSPLTTSSRPTPSRPSPRPSPSPAAPPVMRSNPSQSSLASAASSSASLSYSTSPRTGTKRMNLAPEPVVEDALRDQAAQAEQAAERLLELAEDEAFEQEQEQDGGGEAGRVTPKAERVRSDVENAGGKREMRTPAMNPAARRLAALGGGKGAFEDSPDPRDGLGGAGKGSWWVRKGENLPPPPPLVPDSPTRQAEIASLIASLQDLSIDATSLRKLSFLSKERPVREVDVDSDAEADGEVGEPATPTQNGHDGKNGAAGELGGPATTTARFWTEERRFEKAYEGLRTFLLRPVDATAPGFTRNVALLLLKDLVDNQFPCLAGEESGLFSLLFKLREDPSRTSIAATESIATLFASRLEPLYGLGSLNPSLSSYLSSSSSSDAPPEAVARSFALGLKLMGTFFEGLPSEVLEDVLPGSKGLIKQALNDPTHSDLRRAAINALVSAQSILKDEQRVTELVGGLERDQGNLLAYYVAKKG
ncbi:hypothetical protein JCM8547_001759 [Rhodosporidiobolus lusitaniae]